LGFFKLAISNPRKNVSGLQAMVAAAANTLARPTSPSRT